MKFFRSLLISFLMIHIHAYGITYGKEAGKDQFPWQIQFGNKNFTCGGVIFDKRHILTAAHCFDNKPPADGIIVKAGGDVKFSTATQLPRVKTYITHPRFIDWNQGVKVNDIAIIILSKDIVFSKSISPAMLPKLGAYDNINQGVATSLSISGWGWDEREKYPEALRYLDELTLLPGPENASWSKESNREMIDHNEGDFEAYMSGQYIGFEVKNSRATCGGDSGSPLVEGSTVLGIASHGSSPDPKCVHRTSFFFTRIEPFLSWIGSIIR